MKSLPLTIILTDDDMDDQEIFQEALDQVDPDVELLTFSNGEELMHYLKRSAPKLPDIIFLDLNMPIKNGKTCLAEIRASSNGCKLPIAIYSTSSSRNHILETQELGANWYISKPSSFNGVKSVLEKVIGMLKKPAINGSQSSEDYFIKF